jgi:hypothetical protein
MRRYGEGGRQRWYGLDALILARKRRRQDETLSEDEVEVASSSWLHEREA